MTKAELEDRVTDLERKLDLIRKLCLIRAIRNDLRNGPHVHAANVYRLVVKMIDDDQEIHRVTRETSRWIDQGMPA